MNKRVLVVGGSEEYPGAVYLAAISAMRSGAESTVIMTPEKVALTINSLSPDLVTVKLAGAHLTENHLVSIQEKLATADVLLLGNGVGQEQTTAALMQELMLWDGPKVVDADALKVLRDNKVTHAILTPNKHEWELLKKHNDIDALLSTGNIIIQKDESTRIHTAKDSEEVLVNPGLHKAGMGDVLAGLCAGYLATEKTLYEAARAATKTSLEIANILTDKKQGHYFLASDIVEELKKEVTLE